MLTHMHPQTHTHPLRSWGPLGWLVPSEIQPLETRSAGFSLTVMVNFLWSFVLGERMCRMCTWG